MFVSRRRQVTSVTAGVSSGDRKERKWGTSRLRDVLLSISEPAAILGLAFGGAVANRVMRYKPGRIITYGGIARLIARLGYLGGGFAPSVWIALPVFLVSAVFRAHLHSRTTA